MSTSVTTAQAYEQMDVPTLKEGIKAEHLKAKGEYTKVRKAEEKALEHAQSCGEMLIALKGKGNHGSFLHELRIIGIPRKTASSYMRIARKWATLPPLAHSGGVKDALKLLNRADSPPAPAPAPPRSSPLILDAEILEPTPEAKVGDIEGELEEPKIIRPAPAPAPAPAPSPAPAPEEKDALTQIMQLLPHLTEIQFKELLQTIQTRWLR